ncbi:facilitated trehalose transporter Tret1 isoform X3 [Cryptotermes secundus]|uniref:facilitated trehalose transporter Tret1 isoform X3 n=1 Tax=Cryptotermes secundus TaxID=105785 RepID=UPI000CD7BD6C|nr:facilitated trehalose transporter Tret1 isoform X3 [Cryptotermes secundus]
MGSLVCIKGTYQNDDSFTSSEDSLLGRHRNRTTISASSSTSTFITGSTGSSIVNIHKHHDYNKCHDRRMSVTKQKELNLLITAPQVPELSTGDDSLKNKVTVEEPSIQDNHVCEIKPQPQPQPQPEHRCSSKNNLGQSAAPQVQIHWGPQVMAALSVSLGSMVVGFASAYTSPALVSMAEPNSTVQPDLQQKSWIGSLMPLSALLGGIAGGPLIETIGRKTTILATALPFIVSWLLIALAVNVPMLYAGRVVAGFCVGIVSLCFPVYLGETLQPEVRGMLGLLPTAFGNVGILLCYSAGKYLNWSMLATLGACIPVPFLVCMLFIPETPRWYFSKAKGKCAMKSLQWLRGKDADISQELKEIENINNESLKSPSGSSFELFNKSNLKPLLISLGLMFFQQMSGINAVVFYTVMIFKAAGSTLDGNTSTIIVGVVNFGSTFLATILIDRFGRKVLLYISSVAMIISLAVLGTFFYLKDHTDTNVTPYGWLPLVSFVIYVIGFSFGFGPIPWLMMGEILPAKIRGSAASIVTGFNWTCTFVVTKTFTDLITGLGSAITFWMFGGICLAGLFFVIFWVPETQGKSLEDIEKKLTGQVRRMSSIANLRPLPMAV